MIMKAEPTAFAVLDVLGYGELMRQEPAEVFMLVKELLQASARNWPIQRDLDRFSHFSGSSHAPTIEYLQFSDTLLIWLQVEDSVAELLRSPSQLVQSICYAASITLASFMATGIPLRGAVGFGPTYISRDPLFLVGGELYSSIKLGEMQTWAGIALHESANKVLLSDSKVEKPEPLTIYSQSNRTGSTHIQALRERLPNMDDSRIEDLIQQLNDLHIIDSRNLKTMMTGSGAQDLRHILTPIGTRFVNYLKDLE